MNIYFFNLVITLFSCFYVKSQNFKIYYNLEFTKDTISKNIEKRSMVLWIEKNNYTFCSQEILDKDSIKDNSIDHSPTIFDEDIEFMVAKKDNTINRFFLVDQILYTINENFTNLNWQIKNQTKNIDNIECQLATLNYKGRNWEAWFSTKYPITIGPYIFNGLPGAIIQLNDTKNNYHFKLTRIENTGKSINKAVFQGGQESYPKPIVITKKQLEKISLSHYSSPFKRMKDKGILYMIDEKTGEKQPPPDFDKMGKSAQKYIRENNNPIELSEAVKYPKN